MRTGGTRMTITIIHNNPIFVKFELSCIDFLTRLETKGLIPVAIENNSVVFRVVKKTEKIVYLLEQ